MRVNNHITFQCPAELLCQDIESNTILTDAEIVGLEEISKLFDDKIEKANDEIKELIREVNQS